MRSFWWVAVAMAACGDVNKIPDAAVIDAYAPDSPTTVMCAPGEMVCNNVCANVMTSEQYCGNCTTQCAPNFGCLAGTCVPANTSCGRVRELDPSVPDGAFRNPNNGAVFACDFTARKQYEFGLGQYNVAHTGYTLMSVASFDVSVKAAFINYYNYLGGLQTLAPFTSGLCCITQANNNELSFGTSPNYLSLSQNGTPTCNIMYNGVYQIMKGQQPSGLLPVQLPPDFFDTSPVGESTACGDTNNIGLFFKTTTY